MAERQRASREAQNVQSCNTAVGDKEHMLLHCPHHMRVRSKCAHGQLCQRGLFAAEHQLGVAKYQLALQLKTASALQHLFCLFPGFLSHSDCLLAFTVTNVRLGLLLVSGVWLEPH